MISRDKEATRLITSITSCCSSSSSSKHTDVCEKADKWLDTNREWESVDEVLKSEEYQEVYEIFKGMLELIGEVSGASLLYGKHFSLFPSAAYFKAKSAERETHGRKSRFDFFREICEMSVSRQVVIQDLIGAQILEEELEERELIRRYKRKKSRQKARRAEAIKRELASKPRNISFTTFVVLCNVFKCEKEHHIEAVRALIEALEKRRYMVNRRRRRGTLSCRC